ncbi:uncharacterized protein LOC130379637 isoform X5 [Gadus chalcogrammus]|uniref:uncharacterized protein LOC130379637 isoform X5 n=1 Tax=Gadus chalcogrammus TaxID=1042646 RepID=UPI0024C29A8E|nr:uncharacterized protein LOC130379637 isoform X5 [Gadus chalcogrammus]
MKAAVPFLVLLSGCCMTWTEALTVKGLVGGTVRIECTHTNAQSNTKYFCKGECRYQDVLITSKTGGSEKYSIEDKGNTFITTMRNLQLKDTGNYWCAIERFGLDTYVEVYLKVNDGSQVSWILTVAMCMESLLFVCLFTFLLWLLARHMRNNTGRRRRQESNREKENDYETMSPVGPPRPESKFVRSGRKKRVLPQPAPNTVPTKPRRPTVSACITIDLNEHADVADSGQTCLYQSLNLNLNEESVYHTLL